MKFGTLLVDPPWSYNRTTKTSGKTANSHKLSGYADTKYGFLTTDELCELPLWALGSDESVLLLCTTWPFLPDALRLIEAWEYEYVTGLTWVKTGQKLSDVAYGVGYWFRGATELVLVGKRDKAYRTNLVGLVQDDLVSPRLEHSRKPKSIYQVGESFPEPRLELFAREQRPGWYSLGDECPGDLDDIRTTLPPLLLEDEAWEKHFMPPDAVYVSAIEGTLFNEQGEVPTPDGPAVLCRDAAAQ